MVTITQGQHPKDNPELEVLSQSGSYDENDLIECGMNGEGIAYCAFEAQYIVNGNQAYDQTVIPT